MHPYVHCSVIYNSQDMEATQLLINGKLLSHKTDTENKQVVARGERGKEEEK